MATESLHISIEHEASGEKRLSSLLRRHFAFHLIFFLFLLGQVAAFIHLLSSSGNSSLLACLLASLVLSTFTYFILHFYLQTRKNDKLHLICSDFVQEHQASSYKEEANLFLANAVYRFAASLEEKEYTVLSSPLPLASLRRAMKKANFFLMWKDIITLRELLLLVSVRQHVDLIKERPTDLETHASLANTYVAIARLYLAPTSPDLTWTHRFYDKEPLKERFTKATEKALQEFEIIDNYAPDDPWVHAQLALCYHDLHMYAEEIKAYETILTLCPDDKEVMYRLGVLYFRQGVNAKGLRIYEELLRLGYSRVEQLLSYYDSHHL